MADEQTYKYRCPSCRIETELVIAPTETVEHGEDDIVEPTAWQIATAVVNLCNADPVHRDSVARYLEEKLARLRRSAPREVGWQPIETVPHDGTPVLVWLPDPMQKSHVHAATFLPNVTVGSNLFGFDATSDPTHWMPLPDPPVGPPIGDEGGQT